jgi:hypothetical protein
MKKLVALFVICGLLVGVAGVYMADAAKAPAKKVVKKAPAKKVVKKAPPKKAVPAPVAPAPPPPPVAPVVPPPVVAKPVAPAGIFGWGLKSAISGTYLYNGKGPYSGAIAGRYDLVLDDPLALGTIVGLSANALKFRVGLGGVYGKDNVDATIKAIPLFVDAVLSLPADLLGGLDMYIGGGVNYNLYGTGKQTGPYGIEAMAGINVDFGLGLGKTGLELGYSVLRAGGNVAREKRSAKGITFSVCQPFVL